MFILTNYFPLDGPDLPKHFGYMNDRLYRICLHTVNGVYVIHIYY